MFRITVAIGDGPNGQWAFHFNDEEKAQTAFRNLGTYTVEDNILIDDDFGQAVVIAGKAILAFNIQDMDKMGDSQNALRLSQAKSELRFQELLEKDTDPLIKKAVLQQKQAERMRMFQQGGGMGGNMPM